MVVAEVTVKANILPDIYLVGAATDTTMLLSGRDSIRFRRLWSYSEAGIPGVRSCFLTRNDTEYPCLDANKGHTQVWMGLEDRLTVFRRLCDYVSG